MLIRFTDSPVHVLKCCFLIARKSVDGAGEKRVADRYCASSYLVLSKRMTPFATGTGSTGLSIVTGVFSVLPNGTSHNPLLLRLPVMRTLLFLSIFRVYFENNAKQSSAHNCPIEISHPVTKSFKIYACCACALKSFARLNSV